VNHVPKSRSQSLSGPESLWLITFPTQALARATYRHDNARPVILDVDDTLRAAKESAKLIAVDSIDSEKGFQMTPTSVKITLSVSGSRRAAIFSGPSSDREQAASSSRRRRLFVRAGWWLSPETRRPEPPRGERRATTRLTLLVARSIDFHAKCVSLGWPRGLIDQSVGKRQSEAVLAPSSRGPSVAALALPQTPGQGPLLRFPRTR
jgi:hypothetical protein